MKIFFESKYPQTPLSEIAKISPKLDKSLFDENELVTFVPMAAVAEKINRIDLKQKRKFKEVQKGYTYFTSGDVLFAKVTPCMENGKIALVPRMDTELGFGSTEFHVIRPNGALNPKLLFYFLVSDQFRLEAEHRMTGAVGLRRVPLSFLQEVAIPIPPLQIQHALLKKIDDLFSEIHIGVTELQRIVSGEGLTVGMMNLVNNLRQAVIKSAFAGSLV